jgi:aryl-alcohol dehydrogenase-like predicted oxidoreductase
MDVDRIDVYYLHNPEEQHARSTPDGFAATMAGAFGVLEEAVVEGLVGSYGVSTWTGVRPAQGWSLESLKGLAGRVAADTLGVADHFTHVQGPLSIGMRDALAPGHPAPGGRLSFVALCSSLGLRYVASAAAGGGRVPALAATSVRWVTQVPGVDTALVGTLSPDHLAQMLS